MYIVGQERRLVDPPSQVVAGVRTVTTNMDGRDALPRMSRPFAFQKTRLSVFVNQYEFGFTCRARIAELDSSLETAGDFTFKCNGKSSPSDKNRARAKSISDMAFAETWKSSF